MTLVDLFDVERVVRDLVAESAGMIVACLNRLPSVGGGEAGAPWNREQDVQWCKAITACLRPKEIAAVCHAYNDLRDRGIEPVPLDAGLAQLREKARWAEKTADYFDGNDLLEPEIELMAEWRALTKEQP